LNKSIGDISVIIPAYNRAALISATLWSLLNQTISAKEIIVVDDGSTDGTAQKAEDEFSVFRQQFSGNSKFKIPTFKILHQENAGPGAARNRGMAESTGEFIHFFDSDDIAAPNKHEVQLKALLETGADIAYGPWVKGRFEPVKAQTVACGELSVASLNPENTRNPQPATRYPGFHPEGPVLQARGLPEGDLVRALLTNWSVVPHACLFRRSIVEKIGGFPEDLFGTEDQMMFLRCLLAGAKVVHSPGTIEFYRVGDPSKITATGAAQKRHAKEWAKFLLKANAEVASAGRSVHSKAIDAGRSALDSRPSTGSRSPATSYSLLATAPEALTTPSAWFGFRLRAYEAWRDLRAFFPGEYLDLETGLQAIWKRSRVSVFGFQVSGFLMRKLGGLKQKLVGHRWPSSFCSEMVTKTSLEAMMK
jgi:GT2 family glycosyltransferase